VQNADMFTMQIELVDQKVQELGKKTNDVVVAQRELGRRAAAEGKQLRADVLDILERPVAGDTACERALNIQRAPR